LSLLSASSPCPAALPWSAKATPKPFPWRRRRWARFYREGASIGTIAHTPGQLQVDRRKYDIIKCDKTGYGEATYVIHSGLVKMVAANVAADIFLTMGVSSAVDSATGADNEYTSDVVIQMNVTGEMTAPPDNRPIPKPLLSSI
jgi:hypothetical protein